MRFTLGIDLTGAAFVDDPDELSRQLFHVAARVRRRDKTEPSTGLVLDANGNTVGSWSIES